MSNAVANTHLVAYTKALEAAGIAIKLVSRVPAPLKSIADQLIRSASSEPANLAEGHGRSGRDRMHFWRIADASAKEVDSHLSRSWGAVLSARSDTECLRVSGRSTHVAVPTERQSWHWPGGDSGGCSARSLGAVPGARADTEPPRSSRRHGTLCCILRASALALLRR